MCLLAGLDMRTSEVAFVGPVFSCPSEPTGRPRRPLLFWGRVCSASGFSGTCVAGLPKTEWLPHDSIGMDFYSFI